MVPLLRLGFLAALSVFPVALAGGAGAPPLAGPADALVALTGGVPVNCPPSATTAQATCAATSLTLESAVQAIQDAFSPQLSPAWTVRNGSRLNVLLWEGNPTLVEVLRDPRDGRTVILVGSPVKGAPSAQALATEAGQIGRQLAALGAAVSVPCPVGLPFTTPGDLCWQSTSLDAEAFKTAVNARYSAALNAEWLNTGVAWVNVWEGAEGPYTVVLTTLGKRTVLVVSKAPQR